MNIVSVPAGRGIAWFKEGWALFRKAPLPFAVMGLIAFSLEMMGSYNPLLELAVCLLSPLFLAGLFWGAQQADRGEAVEIGGIFRGFHQKSVPLLKLGTIMLGFLALIVMVLVLALAPAMMEAMTQMGMPMGPGSMHETMTPEEVAMLMSALSWNGMTLGGLLIALLLAVISTLGMVFAIPLIIFHDYNGWAAFSASIKANMIAWAPISVAGGLFLLLSVPAIVTFIGMLILFPVTFTALYVAQKELFTT